MDWRRRKIARGEYEIGTSSAREAKALEVAAYGAAPRKPRVPKADARAEADRLIAEYLARKTPQ